MRRPEKEIKDTEEINAILQSAPVCRIAMAAGDEPYVVTVNFAASGSWVYFHSAPAGRKIDMLRKNAAVCFEVDLPSELVSGPIACSWGMAYRSVIGFGRAYFIEERGEKKKALDLLMRKYSQRDGFSYADDALDKVCVIGVKLDQVTGKKSG